jgi:hypothetical protein
MKEGWTFGKYGVGQTHDESLLVLAVSSYGSGLGAIVKEVLYIRATLSYL